MKSFNFFKTFTQILIFEEQFYMSIRIFLFDTGQVQINNVQYLHS
jgi:hypothetical protein